MRMELHGVSHDVCYLVITPVVHAFHGVHDTSLHRLEAVLNIGNGTFKDNIRRVVKEPVLVHAREVVHDRCVEAVYGFIIGVGLRGVRCCCGLRRLWLLGVFYFVVHIRLSVI